jgi:hypothetical protein
VSTTAHQAGLEALLQHPSLWRGRSAARHETFPTGFDALDRALPGGGWPCRGLIEVLICGSGSGELGLWAPLVARLSQSEAARWCAFISPPFEPYAPAWLSRGARAEHLLVAHSNETLWAMEQSLLSGACALVFGWMPRITMRELRRLALAAEKGAALAILIRPLRAAQEHSAAMLRMTLQAADSSLQLRVLKGRGMAPQCIELPLP